MKKITFIFVATLLLCMGSLSAQSRYNQDAKKDLTGQEKNALSQEFIPTEDFPKGLASQIFWGHGDAGGGVEKGAIRKSTLGTPFPGTAVGTSNSSLQGFEYINGELYATRYNESINNLGKINMTTGAWTTIGGNITNADISSICYNPVNNLTYVFPFTGSGTNGLGWGTINLTTGVFSQLGTMQSGAAYNYFAAIDNDGIAYATTYESPSRFGTINLTTGVFSTIATLSINASGLQNMSIDRETNELYWLQQGSGNGMTLYKVNKTTGALTNLGNYPDSDYWAFTTITEATNPAAPAAVTALTATPGANGALTAAVTWTNPTLTHGGQTLTSLTAVKVYGNNNALLTTINNPTIGGPGSYNATVTTAGEYTFKIVPENAAGIGDPASVTKWIGPDVPAAPTAVTLTQNVMTANLSWTAPTAGLHSGYFTTAGLVYDVYRLPNTLVSGNQTGTTFTETITQPGLITYKVVAKNASGEGGSANSNAVSFCVTISTFPWNYGFEDVTPPDLPACWTEVVVGTGTVHWTVRANGYDSYPANAHGGTKYANFGGGSTRNQSAWLISPRLDLTSLGSPKLSFWHTQYDWGGTDVDTLGVYYRTSATGAWNYLISWGRSVSITTWQEAIVSLPNPTNDYYIGFLSTTNYGHSCKIDDISIYHQETRIITATAGPNGTITPSGAVSVDLGANKSFVIAPNTGYHVLQVLVDGSPVQMPAAGGTYTFTNVTVNHTISVTFEINTYTITSSVNGSNGTITPLGATTVAHGTNQSYTITPALHYHVAQVLVDGNPVSSVPEAGGTYTFTNVTTNHTIVVSFAINTYTITSSVSGGSGTITPLGVVTLIEEANQLYTITPYLHYHIVHVLVDGAPVSIPETGGTYEFTNIMANHTIVASFEIDEGFYSIIATAGDNGSILPEGEVTVALGSNPTFIFYPAAGYEIDQVLVDDVNNPAAIAIGYYTFANVHGNHTIHVTFKILTFTITATHTGGGHIQPSGIAHVNYWEHSETYVFVAEPGYHVKDVLVDGVSNPAAILAGFYRFLNVAANHTIHVIFELNNYTITATATSGGEISPAGGVLVPHGGNRTFFMNGYTDHELVRVLIDGTNDATAVTNGYYIFSNVTGNHTITAQFERKKLNVYLPTDQGAIITPESGFSSPVEFGDNFMFKVNLLEGYTLSNFTVRANNVVILPAGDLYIINNIVVDQYITITELKLNKYDILSKTNTGGKVSPLGITKVEHGGSQLYTIMPNEDYKVDDVKIDGISYGALDFYEFTNVKANAKIEAFFKYAPNSINDPALTMIEVYSHQNVVTLTNTNLIPVQSVEIIDMYGRLVWQGNAVGETTNITLNVATGIYTVRVTTDANITTTKVSITK